jgi:hypothetical protein
VGVGVHRGVEENATAWSKNTAALEIHPPYPHIIHNVFPNFSTIHGRGKRLAAVAKDWQTNFPWSASKTQTRKPIPKKWSFA